MVCNVKAIAPENERAIERHTPSHYHHVYNTLLDCVNTFAGHGVAIVDSPFRTFARIALGRPVDDALETAYGALCNMLDHNILINDTAMRFYSYFDMLKLLLGPDFQKILGKILSFSVSFS